MTTDILSWYLKYKNVDKKGKIVFLCTHPETQLSAQRIYQGKLNSEFTSKGVGQLNSLTSKIKPLSIYKVYSSPTERSLKTANAIAKIMKLKVQVIDNFRATNFGSFEGKKRSELLSDNSDFFQNRHGSKFVFEPYPNGESYLDLYFRVLGPVLSIVASETPCLIVAHSTLNRVIRSILLESPLSRADEFTHQQGFVLRIELDTKKEQLI